MIDTTKLKQAVDELNQITDVLNQRLEAIEKEIQEVGPGLIVWIHRPEDKTKYGYCRFDDAWHLAVKPENEDPKPILNAARYYRHQCYLMRQQIVDALFKVANATSERWKKQINTDEIDTEIEGKR